LNQLSDLLQLDLSQLLWHHVIFPYRGV